MPPAVTIREATLDDVQGIQHVAHDAYHAAYGDVVDADALDAQLEEWYSVEGVQNRVIRAGSTLLVADHDTHGVVGYASGGPTPDGDDVTQPPPRDQATLYTCYVHPDDWNERIGHALLESLETCLRDREFETMQIPVLAENDRAREFYDDHGYTVDEHGTVDFAGVELEEVVHHGTL
jgi:ribosomal protein S18 acetylase RimI-like enzyme